jgi:hypothetical protein
MVDGSCMTATGRTLAQNLEACPPLKKGQQVRARPAAEPSGAARCGAHGGARPSFRSPGTHTAVRDIRARRPRSTPSPCSPLSPCLPGHPAPGGPHQEGRPHPDPVRQPGAAGVGCGRSRSVPARPATPTRLHYTPTGRLRLAVQWACPLNPPLAWQFVWTGCVQRIQTCWRAPPPARAQWPRSLERRGWCLRAPRCALTARRTCSRR